MDTSGDEIGCAFPKPSSQWNDDSDDVYYSANADMQSSTFSTDEDQFYSLRSIERVGTISCKTGDSLVMETDDPSSQPCRHDPDIQQTTSALGLPFEDQLRGSENGTTINLSTMLTQFQSLSSKVMELRDSNRKILRNLNLEENFHRKKKKATERARQEMENQLTKLENRWESRQDRINLLKSTLDGISQNVDKLETIIKTQNEKLKSHGDRDQGRIQDIQGVPARTNVTTKSDKIPASGNNRDRETGEKIKRNEIGFKCKTVLGDEDNRIPTLRRKQRKIQKSQKKKEENRKKNITATGVNRGATAENDSLLMEGSRDLNRRERKRSDKPRDAAGRLPTSDTVTGQDKYELIDPNRWKEWAQNALDIGERERSPTGEGPCTILLLDISSSMAGEPFAQMKNIAKQLVQDIGNYSDSIGENVALVTFGHDTRIIKYACNDYRGIIHEIEHLRVGGPSPMVGGLYMALAAGLSCSKKSICNVAIRPRIILISDGDATSEQILAGPDGHLHFPFVTKNDIHHELLHCASRICLSGIKIYCVPVDNADKMHLEGISTTSNGKVYSPQQIGRLSKMYKNMQVVLNMKSQNEPLIKIMLQTGAFMGELDPGDIEDVMSYMIDPEYQEQIHQEFDANLPCIGTRVRRGPLWHHGDQDKNCPGTVIGQISHGMVLVEWDCNSSQCYRYHYGVNGDMEIVIVDEPRIISENQLIAVGCRVKRGKDWRYGDEDGGARNVGVVFSLDNNSNVAVRWPNKLMKTYKYGNKGYFEVELCDTPKRDDKNDEKGWSYVIGTGTSCVSVEEMNRKNNLMTEKFMQSAHERKVTDDMLSNSSLLNDSDVDSIYSEEEDVQSDVSGDEEITNYKWEYVDSGGIWKAYPMDVISKIEQAYQRTLHSDSGTTLVHINGFSYRILFSKMEQINTSTKESSNIRRIELKSKREETKD